MTVTRRRIARNILSGIALGVIPAVVQLVFGGMSLRRFAESALIGCLYAFCISAPCWLTVPVVFQKMGDRPLASKAAACGLLFAVFSFNGCLFANAILLLFGVLPLAAFWPTFLNSLRICVFITFTFGVLSVVVTMLMTRLNSTQEELRLRQIAEERQSKIAAEARFASLESRVHPHFLFNTLNSISALVRENPAEAERMIERLAALLRYSLDSDVAGLVPLREELRIVAEYLAIEQVRFGSRLRFRVDADPEAGACHVPALSVQTLVENSVKYAVGARREGAEIVVTAYVENGALRIVVTDDGPGFPSVFHPKPGHGLDLLKRRLEALFGHAASLKIGAPGGLTSVAIRVTGI
jgi:two-component system sensor histidine kinase AlgZ